jgi:hypothetical protein
MLYRSLVRLMLITVCILGQAQQQSSSPQSSTGSVNGSLLTYDAKPAAGYVVDIIGTSISSTQRRRALTTEEGAFAFEEINVGEYVIAPYFEGESSRYPGGTSSFYDPDPVRIQITLSEPTKRLTIHLGPPNRILNGAVSSSLDGSPITSTIQIEYPDNPDRFIRFSCSRDGQFRVLIPPKTQLTMKATAPGYLPVTQVLEPIPDDSDQRVEIRLKPAGSS